MGVTLGISVEATSPNSSITGASKPPNQQVKPNRGKAVEGKSKTGGTEITNDIVGKPRVGGGVKGEGSGAKIDHVKPITDVNEKGQQIIIKEFPATPRAHGFTEIVDNYAGSATKFDLGNGATLYQIEGSLNGVAGRFEWITQNGNVTHRMFVQGGTINGEVSR